MKAKIIKNDAVSKQEPSFFVNQLVKSKAISASPDVIRAVLQREKRYTMAEAQEAIKNYLARKV